MCIPHTGSFTSRLLATTGFGGVSPGAVRGALAPPITLPNSFTAQETTNTQNRNRNKRPRKLIALPALAAPSPLLTLPEAQIGLLMYIRLGEPSVCKGESTRQTKLCSFNKLRGRSGTRRASKPKSKTKPKYLFFYNLPEDGEAFVGPRLVRYNSASPRREFGRCPYNDGGLRVPGWNRRLAGSFPRPRSRCGLRPGQSRSMCAEIRSCRRLWA